MAVPLTEAAAYQELERLRWGGRPSRCPRCGGAGRCSLLRPRDGGQTRRTRTGSPTSRRVWFCGHCRRQFSVLTDTILAGTRIAVRTWLLAMCDVDGALDAVSPRARARMRGRLRAASRFVSTHGEQFVTDVLGLPSDVAQAVRAGARHEGQVGPSADYGGSADGSA